MNQAITIYILTALCFILLCVVLYQKFISQRAFRSKLNDISRKIADILDSGSDESVMVFTDDSALIELASQINRLLESRQKMKAEFRRGEISSKKMLSNISHDIKTPLTVILGYLEILRMENQEDEMLEKVESKAKQVMELINQFFTLAKIEAGDMDISLSRIDINEVCKESILDFYDILTQREFEVEVSVMDTPLFVQGDKSALDRILFNLLSNALRYGGEGQYLGLFVREDEAWVYVDVMDKGKGIDKIFANHVFDRLFTMEDSRNREIQGNGLGLTIAKNLAQRLGGDILLSSEPHVKTVFTLKLKKYW